MVVVLALAGLLAALSLSACGGGGSTTGGGTTSGGSGGGESEGGSSTSAEVAHAEKELAALYKGEYGKPPSESPPPQKGANVWAIGVGYQSESTHEAVLEFQEIGESLGWNVTLRDGKFDPSTQLAEIREAVRAHADAILLVVIECEPVKAGLLEAKEAGIIIFENEGADCEPPLFSGELNFYQGNDAEFSKRIGEMQAIWTVANTEADAKVLLVFESDLKTTKLIANAFKERMAADCKACEITEEVPFTGAEFGPALQQKVEQALLQNPETTVVYGNYDGAIEGGIGSAVRSSGKDLKLIGLEGQKYNVELVREGVQSMGVGFPYEWTSYAAADSINRLLAGETELPNSGAGLQVFDAEHNLPPKGHHFEVTAVPFAKLYHEAWGIK